MYETGLKNLCIFYNMKNHDLTLRIPPEVNKCQADSWRIKMFVPSYCSISSLFQTNYPGPSATSGQQAWSLETHYVRLKMRDNSCQSQNLMPLTCFHGAESMLASCTIERIRRYLNEGFWAALRWHCFPLRCLTQEHTGFIFPAAAAACPMSVTVPKRGGHSTSKERET